LKQPEQDIVGPKISHMMISNPICPQSQYPVKWNEYREEIGDHEHGLGSDVEILLYVPETESGRDRASCLRNAEICDLKE
jgi:hypothetical protein